MTITIPYGLCQCGCGQPAPIATKTVRSRGVIKGQPLRYIKNHYWKHPERQLLVRFWQCVDKRSPDECWNWTGTVMGSPSKGIYGAIRAQKVTGERKPMRAHRLSYEIAYGKIPEGLFVLHRCDNTRCVNPAHLFLGTIADNNRDRAQKDRGSRLGQPMPGERNPSAKLTAVQVKDIRRLYDSKQMGVMALSRQFGMSRGQIGRIVHRQSWKLIRVVLPRRP